MEPTNKWHNRTIIVVEDESMNFTLISYSLKKTGVNLVWAKNGKECVNLISRNHRTFDMILMDIQMPEMNGIEASRWIRDAKKRIPIIMQSAYVNDYRGNKHIADLFDDFLPKPFRPTDLIRVVSKFFDTQQELV